MERVTPLNRYGLDIDDLGRISRDLRYAIEKVISNNKENKIYADNIIEPLNEIEIASRKIDEALMKISVRQTLDYTLFI